MFITREILKKCSWQAFERLIARLLIVRGYEGVRVVGGSGDKGADIIAIKNRRRWLIQAKHWRKPIGKNILKGTIEAGQAYRAKATVVVGLEGFDDSARDYQKSIIAQGHNLTLWSSSELVEQAQGLQESDYYIEPKGDYQDEAIKAIVESIRRGSPNKGMVVMATGLGKTFTAAESIRRIRKLKKNFRVLVLAHTVSLVEQLERAFWPFLGPRDSTLVWTQNEPVGYEQLASATMVFASRDSVANHCKSGRELDGFDLVLIDECHHAHSSSKAYLQIINTARAGEPGGPYLLGLTATPFLADSTARLEPIFGDYPLITIDMVYGLRHGFLSQIDYRMHTDNIRWEGLKDLTGNNLSPKQINRALFVKEWDDAVVNEIQNAWNEIKDPKAIVFCGTIEHAMMVCNQINARSFCRASVIFSGEYNGKRLSQHERNLLLCDFQQGDINIICTVDIFNEGLDVPDVNIIVFNRVTHSRRIFIQQLGRGLRIAKGKHSTLVLDFAQDIRRLAAGLKLKDGIMVPPKGGVTVSIGNKVVFKRVGGEDQKAETFLRAWIEDVERLESAGEDIGILKFPPELS